MTRQREGPGPAEGRLHAVHELGVRLLGASSVHEIASATIAVVTRRLGCTGAWLAEVDRRRSTLVVLDATGRGRLLVDTVHSVPLDGPSPLARSVRTGDLLWLGSPQRVADTLPHLAELIPDAASVVLKPLSAEGERGAVAVLGLCFGETRPRRPSDVAFLTAAGDLAGQAIRVARLRHDQDNARRDAAATEDRARRVGRLAAALVAAVSLEDVVTVLADQVQHAVEADTFSLRRVFAEQGVASAMRLRGSTIGYRGRFADVPLDMPGALAEAARTRTAVFIESAEEHRRRYGRNGVDGYEQARIHGLARLPLVVEDELLAIMSVGYRTPQAFPDDQRLFLTTVADLAAQALGRAIRTERLRELQSLSDLALVHTSLPELVEDISGRLAGVLRASRVQLYLYDAKRRALQPVAGEETTAVHVRDGVLAEAMAGRRAMAVNDPQRLGPEELDPALRRSGSLVVLPLPIGTAVVGVLVAAREQPVPFTGAELELLDMAAGRMALAVDRARASESQRELARTLQAALVPTMLPVIPGMSAAARYAAAGAGIEVGGDFYDVFALDDGQWLAVIGDVRGRGPGAAAITGLIRHTVRAVAVEVHEPAAILARVNAVLHADTGPEEFATVACVRIRPGDEQVELTIACAGHCRPLVLRAEQERNLQVVEAPGPVVGAFPDFHAAQQVCRLSAGDVLLLHTDGLTEAAGDGGRFGEARLTDQLCALAGQPVDDIVTAVHDAVLAHCGGICDDDLAILAFAVPPAASGEPEVLVDLVVPPGPGAAGTARRSLDGLHGPGIDPDLLADLRLAVSELVTNAVRHGYSEPPITLRVTRNDECLRAEVGNVGDPYPALGHPSEASPLAEHGRGLLIVTGTADRTGFHRDGDRIHVWCEFRLRPVRGGTPVTAGGG